MGGLARRAVRLVCLLVCTGVWVLSSQGSQDARDLPCSKASRGIKESSESQLMLGLLQDPGVLGILIVICADRHGGISMITVLDSLLPTQPDQT